MSIKLDDSVKYLKGVGERRAVLLGKLGIKTCNDLLNFAPRTYIDLTAPLNVSEAYPGDVCAVRAEVTSCGSEQRIRKGLSLFKLTAGDSSGNMQITFFNNKYLVSSLKVGQEYIFYGKIEGTLFRKEMSSPQVFSLSSKGWLVPVYPLTAGINSKFIASCVKTILTQFTEFNETLPDEVRSSGQLCARDFALRNLHFPKDEGSLAIAKKRLIFEELFYLSLSMAQLKAGRTHINTVPMMEVPLKSFYSALPFSPTRAQLRVIDEAAKDLYSSAPMNRLIQGDVGSGKTLVAAACAWITAQNASQSALMAPTEILAEQHYSTMQSFFVNSDIRIGLLTGSMTAAQKRKVKQQLASGEIDLLVGTHAIITDDVIFKDLRLVITDEQHRFGVRQRLALTQKGEAAHTLVMSATPIPRTLALIIYGELDVSVIDELPPGRSPVETYKVGSDKRKRAINFIIKHLDEGKQAYIVCPLIEQDEEEETSLTTAKEYSQQLAEGELVGYSVGLIHGRLAPKEKEKVMHSFKNGEIQVLVSTTVIEVGVDVPNAVIMMIENAERFGLSQLHQLRGRVGRGKDKAYCILISDAKSEETVKRLSVMCSTTDGFKIAEEDLSLRGPGDFFGHRQHGLPELRFANFAANMTELSLAQAAAEKLTKADPALKAYPNIKSEVDKLLSLVGERPN